jgi:hypothetical protein
VTHFWPGSDRDVSVREAADVFDGEILTATEDMIIPLPTPQ